MWYRGWRHRFGPGRGGYFGPFAFHFGFGFPRRSEYRRWLEEYKGELEEELKAVEEELRELRGEETHQT